NQIFAAFPEGHIVHICIFDSHTSILHADPSAIALSILLRKGFCLSCKSRLSIVQSTGICSALQNAALLIQRKYITPKDIPQSICMGI
ncbi:MAG: hypothetical protein IJ181_08865, partial [Acidaminococcaceae bacterium]|nr:hypothetical protein [Acidaminococcaceae bacterium]